MSTTQTKLLIVDDHPLVREGLKGMIASDARFSVCGETGSIRVAKELIRETSPDIVILDLSLEDGNSLELIPRLKRQNPEIRILVCSMHDELLFAERTIESGANGYINKHEAAEHIISALRHILSGKLYLNPILVDRIVTRAAGKEPRFGSSIDALTDRELQVFLLIGKGLSTSAIAEQLVISVKTVDTHRDKIKRKLGLKSAGQLIRAAVQWELEQYRGNPMSWNVPLSSPVTLRSS